MITLSQRREVGEFRKRYRWMALFVLLVFGVIIARVAQVQLFQRDRWSGIAQQNITKTLELPATRGRGWRQRRRDGGWRRCRWRGRGWRRRRRRG